MVKRIKPESLHLLPHTASGDMFEALAAHFYEMRLYDFLQAAWPNFDPSPFVGGWHLQAICEHLEAVSNGEIKRLLINVSPRSSKTSAVAIAWPCWTWAQKPDSNNPMIGPGVRFLCASYGANKAKEDGVTARRLLASPWYRSKWGHRVQIAAHRDNQERYDTTAGGSRINTGIPESLGKGGLIRICFPADQVVQTEAGPLPIGEIVERRLALRVWSLSRPSGRPELRPITGWHRNPASPLVRLALSDGSAVRCTPEHRFLTASGDWLAAREIPLGTRLPAFRARQAAGDMPPLVAPADNVDVVLHDPVPLRHEMGRLTAGVDVANGSGGELGPRPLVAERKGPVLLGVGDVLGASSIDEVAQTPIGGAAVFVANLVPLRHRAHKGQHDKVMQEDVVGGPVAAQGEARIPLVHAAGQQLRFQPVGLTLLHDGAPDAPHASEVGNLVIGEAGDLLPDFVAVVAIDHAGFASDTYCISVSQNRNMLVGERTSIPAANCDDPHKSDEVESAQTRDAVIRAYKEIWSTRSNDPQHGAEVMIMQRLAENDLSGYWLEHYPDVVHLCIPALFDGRVCRTRLGWRDPRTTIGESYWPQRFGPADWEKKKHEVGPYAFAGQFQQIPQPRGGGIIKSEWWKVWPPEGDESAWQREVPDEDGQMRLVTVFPDFEYVVVSCDGAYTAKEENDYCACTVWGVFRDRAKNPRLMLISAWRERLELHAFVRRVMDTAKRRQADVVLMEAKATGISAAQEIHRLSRDGEFNVLLIDPGRADKAARLHATVALFNDGVIYAPDRKWASMVIEEVAGFPRAPHDDLVDTASQALNWMRKRGLALLAQEAQQDETAARSFTGNGRVRAAKRYEE